MLLRQLGHQDTRLGRLMQVGQLWVVAFLIVLVFCLQTKTSLARRATEYLTTADYFGQLIGAGDYLSPMKDKGCRD